MRDNLIRFLEENKDKKIALFSDMDGVMVQFEFDYNNSNDVLYLLGDSQIIDKSFTDKVVYICLVSENTFLKLNKYKTEILEKVLIKKS